MCKIKKIKFEENGKTEIKLIKYRQRKILE